MTNAVLGIDVSKATLDVALLNGRSYHHIFDNTEKGFEELEMWLEKHQAKASHVCLEATGQYGFPVAKHLYRQGYPVSVVNPFRIKAYRKTGLVRNKTDKMDAFVIADFCKRQQPDLWRPPEPCYAELRALTRHLDSLKDMRQQERNRSKAGITSNFVLQMIAEHIAQLEQGIEKIKGEIQRFIASHPQLQYQKDLLVSILGIADLSAANLLAEIQDISRFENVKQLDAYAGIAPEQHSSGSSVHGKSRMSKVGNVYLRKNLYMPALVAKRYNPIVKAFCARLEERKKPPMVILGAAMRKLLHIIYGVLKNGQPFDPDYLLKATQKA